MTDDQIIALAKSLGWNIEHAETNRMLVLFARSISSQERETCAQICEDHPSSDGDWCAQQIRGPLSNMSKKNKRPLPYEPDPR